MIATFKHPAGVAARRLVIGLLLGLIGVVVGLGCVLLPIGVPVGIVAVAAMLLLWLLPEMQSVPKAWTSAMLVPFTIILLCVPTYFGLILPGLPWISIRRAAVLAWIIPLVIIFSGSAESRLYVISTFRLSKALRFCVCGFVAIMALSVPISVAPATSLSYSINFTMNCIAPMLAVIFIIRREETLIRLFKAALFGAVVCLIVGSIEFHLKRPFLIYLLPTWMRDQIFDVNPTAAATLISGLAIRGGWYRASSVYTTPLSWGEISAMLVPMSLHFVAHGKSYFQKLYGAAGTTVCFVSVALSGSRGAYVGAIAAAITYSVAWSVRSLRKTPNSLAGGIWLTLYTMVATSTLMAVMFVGRVHKLVLGGSETQGSTDARAAEWALAQPKIIARPLLGYGAGTAGDVIHFTLPGGIITVDGFHMNLLVDFGIPGFILFFGQFLISMYMAFAIYIRSDAQNGTTGAALGASLLAFVVYRFTLSQIDSLSLAFMLLGTTAAYCRFTQRLPARGQTRNRADRGASLLAPSLTTGTI